MNPSRKILTLGVMLAASSSLAFASPLSGPIPIDAGDHAIDTGKFFVSVGADYILTQDGLDTASFAGAHNVLPTPEPSSLILLGTGLAGAAGLIFRKRRSANA